MNEHRRPRVLIADDYPGLPTAVARLLAASCDVVGHVAGGTELLDTVARLQPDVVVADVHLPEVHGFEVCSRIRESHQARVVLISAAIDPAFHDRALAAGASAFVGKYRLAEELAEAVKKAFDQLGASDGSPIVGS